MEYDEVESNDFSEDGDNSNEITCKEIMLRAKLAFKWFLQDAELKVTFDDVMMGMTLFVLFADSFKVIYCQEQADYGFSVANTICFFFFIGEFLMNTWIQSKISLNFRRPEISGYIFSFFWFCDVIAIVSMFPDISWIANPLGIGDVANATSGNANYKRAGRIVRLIRLIRLIRLFKIYMERKKREKEDEILQQLVASGELDEADVAQHKLLHDTKKSKLGSQLSATIIQRVIILILVILIILPLTTYTEKDSFQNLAAQLAHRANIDYHSGVSGINCDSLRSIIHSLIVDVKDLQGTKLLMLSMTVDNSTLSDFGCGSSSNDKYWIHDSSKMESLRPAAMINYYLDNLVDGHQYKTELIFNVQSSLAENAEYSIYMTIFIGALMIGGATIFTNDAQELVLNPIERMMSLVELIAQDPLRPIEDLAHLHSKEVVKPGDYEMKLLENTIKKITDLLRVGFGEAGAGIIAANLDVKGSSKGLNATLPGQRVYAIVGFCDIHHFEDVLAALAADVLPFVNSIANIVHSAVHTWKGQCNKNLGNAFVIVWRIENETKLAEFFENQGFIKKDKKKDSRERSSSVDSTDKESNQEETFVVKKAFDLRKIPSIDILADSALIAYLKVIVEINRDDNLLFYRNEPRLIKMMNPDMGSTHIDIPITPAVTPSDKNTHASASSNAGDLNRLAAAAAAADRTSSSHQLEKFKVSMGFGLHAGWAIEGAVGSNYKIDATYLSPHVNMAARLETSSRQYGVPLLMSHFCHELLSEPVQKLCRRVDVVTVKGSEVPIGVYTYDALQDQVFKSRNTQDKALYAIKRMSVLSKAKKPTPAAPVASQESAHGPNVVVPISNSSDSRARLPSADLTGDSANAPASYYASNPLPLYKSPTYPVHFSTPAEESFDVFAHDIDLLMLRSHITPEFTETFDQGLKFYLGGHWSDAKSYFDRCNTTMSMVPGMEGDGPSKTLLKYMAAHDFKAPDSWAGYRPLTSK